MNAKEFDLPIEGSLGKLAGLSAYTASDAIDTPSDIKQKKNMPDIDRKKKFSNPVKKQEKS